MQSALLDQLHDRRFDQAIRLLNRVEDPRHRHSDTRKIEHARFDFRQIRVPFDVQYEALRPAAMGIRRAERFRR